MKKHKLSIYIDDPPYFLFWPLPDAIPLLFSICIGIYLDAFVYSVVLGIFITWVLRKFNQKQKPGYLLHIIYSMGWLFTKSKTLPNPFINKFH